MTGSQKPQCKQSFGKVRIVSLGGKRHISNVHPAPALARKTPLKREHLVPYIEWILANRVDEWAGRCLATRDDAKMCPALTCSI